MGFMNTKLAYDGFETLQLLGRKQGGFLAGRKFSLCQGNHISRKANPRESTRERTT
jgi:hypothetical protein